ncbi:uncharacterized protein LOC113466943 [Diaphorina citri]|uniref:Uncharacterized protein LOC113466943 n=1 Tax=Diaphorina citri TaxID=121845 RepID=A0A3Q0IQL3_DIACI|nr:uncharacterized protein LOC113466943 [Diaphorina citri]
MEYQLLSTSPSSLDGDLDSVSLGNSINNNTVSIKYEKQASARSRNNSEDNYVLVFLPAAAAAGVKDGDSASKENIAGKMQKSSEPIKTTTYTVEASDTLTSVAARFDTTPSELAILNRLHSRTVFPGQVIRVPEKTKRRKKPRISSTDQPSSGNEVKC